MQVNKKLIFVPLIICILSSCGGSDGDGVTKAAVSHVDSITQSAPDTLRASTDTSARKKDTFSGAMPNSVK